MKNISIIILFVYFFGAIGNNYAMDNSLSKKVFYFPLPFLLKIVHQEVEQESKSAYNELIKVMSTKNKAAQELTKIRNARTELINNLQEIQQELEKAKNTETIAFNARQKAKRELKKVNNEQTGLNEINFIQEQYNKAKEQHAIADEVVKILFKKEQNNIKKLGENSEEFELKYNSYVKYDITESYKELEKLNEQKELLNSIQINTGETNLKQNDQELYKIETNQKHQGEKNSVIDSKAEGLKKFVNDYYNPFYEEINFSNTQEDFQVIQEIP